MSDCQLFGGLGSHTISLATDRKLDIWHTLVLLWVGLQGDSPLYILLVVNVHLELCGNLQ